MSEKLDLFVTVMFLENSPAVLSLGNSAKIMGTISIGPEVKSHISFEMAER